MTGRRRSDRKLRGKLRSPGRPPVARQEHRRRFWAFIAAGMTSEDAAMEVGVSQPVGTRWFRQAGGTAPSHLAQSAKLPSGRDLSSAEREEIALLRVAGLGVREVARRLGRAPSTISRELRRNAATRGGQLGYRATTVQGHAERAGSRPKAAKLATNPELRSYVQKRLGGAVVTPGGLRSRVRRCRERAGDMGGVSTADGGWPGARSRSLSAYGSITRTTGGCGSATRRSTRRSTFRAEGR
jgi:transposase-like protein